jgi:manganese/zinc/iron transport system permease protein
MKTWQVWAFIGGFTALAVLFVPLSQAVWGVSYDYTLRVVALGGTLLGILSGVVGCFAVMRQQSLMGDALSHAALPGVVVAFMLFGRDLGVLLLGAGVASWLAIVFIRAVTHTTRIKQDSAMAIALVAWFALGMALLAHVQGQGSASQAGLDKFIFGQAAAIVESDVQTTAIVGAVCFALIALFWKELKLLTFDSAFAQANGFPTHRLDLLLSSLVVVAVVLGLQLAGVILMVGLLIAPPIAARQWTQRLSQMAVLSGVFGGFAGGVGAVISALDVKLPTGPLIIIVAFGLVVFSLAFAPSRGLVWQWRKARPARLKVVK